MVNLFDNNAVAPYSIDTYNKSLGDISTDEANIVFGGALPSASHSFSLLNYGPANMPDLWIRPSTETPTSQDYQVASGNVP